MIHQSNLDSFADLIIGNIRKILVRKFVELLGFKICLWKIFRVEIDTYEQQRSVQEYIKHPLYDSMADNGTTLSCFGNAHESDTEANEKKNKITNNLNLRATQIGTLI